MGEKTLEAFKEKQAISFDRKFYHFKSADQRGFVYFVQAGTTGPIKIGFTKQDPARRIRAIQDLSPHRLRWIGLLGCRASREREIHKRFAAEALRGEWFRATSRLLAFIEAECPSFQGHAAEDDIFHTSLLKRIKSAVGKKHPALARWKVCLLRSGVEDTNAVSKWFLRDLIPDEEMIKKTKRAFELFLEDTERAAA